LLEELLVGQPHSTRLIYLNWISDFNYGLSLSLIAVLLLK